MAVRPIRVYNGTAWEDIGVYQTDAVLPAAGSTSQVLAKASATDYDVAWIDPPAGGGAGWAQLFMTMGA